MNDYRSDFGPFTEDRLWLNSASEGPLPKVSVKALQEAIQWKIEPYFLTNKRFVSIPRRLRESCGRLLNADPDDIILGNSATYGIHLLANGLPFGADEEVLVMRNDFPSSIIPWLALEKRGVSVRQLKPAGQVLTPDEVEQQITSKTKLVCLSHIHTFSGHAVDIEAIGRMCRDKEITFVVNLTQTLGNQPVDVSTLFADAVTTAGYKWLCGPYGTGFCWIKPRLREHIRYNNTYWSRMLSPEQLNSTDAIHLEESSSARRYDVYGTANFFNFVPLTASLDYLLGLGLNKVQQHIQTLVARIHDGLNQNRYHFISPVEPEQRSALVYISDNDPEKNAALHQRLIEQKIYLGFWKGNLRIAPHIFNTADDIDRLLAKLDD